jgi:hypothetical protein
MSAFLPEAVEMAEYCEERPGNTFAGLEFLDLHPHYRISLECLTQSSNGNLFEEQENYAGGDSLPVHLRKERGFYLNKTKDFSGVQSLLEVMKGLYATPGYTATAGIYEARRWFLKRCETLGDASLALEAMSEYFKTLVDQLEELEPGDGMTYIEECVVGAVQADRDVFECTVPGYTMYINARLERDEDGGCGVTTRQVLVHTSCGDVERDWIQRQPSKWRHLFFDMRKCKKLADLPFFNSVIREKTEKKVYKGAQLRVLWDTYFGRRDYLREIQKNAAALNMGECATKLIASIERQVDRVHLARKVAPCLYAWFKGEEFMKKTLPGQMTKAEWSVVWDRYKEKKQALSA